MDKIMLSLPRSHANRSSFESSDSQTHLNPAGNVPRRATVSSSDREPTSVRSILRTIGESFRAKPGILVSLRAIALHSYLNVFLFCVPICWALHFATPNQDVAIFCTGFLAIIPLAKLLAFATDELSLRVGQAFAGLLNAFLVRSVELIVAITALKNCELGIVQSSLIGSILSNLLLVLGMCFFFGGLKFSEQTFAAGASELNSSFLVLTATAILLPALYQMSQKADGSAPTGTSASDAQQDQILKLSRGIAFILLITFAGYFVFQFTHPHVFNSENVPRSRPYEHKPKARKGEPGPNAVDVEMQSRAVPQVKVDEVELNEPEEIETPQLNILVCFGLMIAVCALVFFTADFLVTSINGLTASGKITKEFVGIILLPIVGNAAEHVSAVTGAVKDKVTMSIGVAVGSSIQIGLFVIPLAVLIGWGMGKPMTLFFDPYEAACLLLAVLTVNYCIQDSKSNWLEGMLLMCLYTIFAIVFFFYPGISTADHFAACI
ncbi:calcium proton exchanger [Mycena galericulata]|nr:calcium proton exchanger [Mycena galericulata]